MRSRLFWKVLLAFWLTLALMTAGAVLPFLIQSRGGRDFQEYQVVIAQLQRERLRSAEAALRYGGPRELMRVTASWPAEARSRLQTTRGADGKVRLSMRPIAPRRFLPFWAIAVQLVAGLIFSAALAAYLAQPIARLRTGFSGLAQGELGLRLTPAMGRRRDEIADLAHDFDAMAERLQHLIASRDRLLHDVSHELRSPLARLSLAVGLARQNRALTEQTLERIEAEAARLNAIVGDLLSLSRAESEAASEEIYFDVASLLQVVCDDARFEAQPRQVRVELELGPELADPAHAPLLTGAPELVRRAVENVIRNALRFSPPGQAVEVGARLQDGSVVIEVRDHGPGAPAALLQSMFDPFVKGPGEALNVGLGLAITRRALAAHNGHVEAFNLDSGGMLMRLTIPAG